MRMKHLSRATALKFAAVISFLLGLSGLIVSLPNLARGAALIKTAGDSPPYFVIFIAIVFAIVKMVAAYGTWQQQRWGIVLTLLATALDIASAVPGLLFAPTIILWRWVIIGIMLNLAVIVFCLWRDHKPATLGHQGS